MASFIEPGSTYQDHFAILRTETPAPGAASQKQVKGNRAAGMFFRITKDGNPVDVVLYVNPETLRIRQGNLGGVTQVAGEGEAHNASQTRREDYFIDFIGLAHGKLSLTGTCGRAGVDEIQRIRDLIWGYHDDLSGEPRTVELHIPHLGLQLEIWLDEFIWEDTITRAFLYPWTLEATILRDMSRWDGWAKTAPNKERPVYNLNASLQKLNQVRGRLLDLGKLPGVLVGGVTQLSETLRNSANQIDRFFREGYRDVATFGFSLRQVSQMVKDVGSVKVAYESAFHSMMQLPKTIENEAARLASEAQTYWANHKTSTDAGLATAIRARQAATVAREAQMSAQRLERELMLAKSRAITKLNQPRDAAEAFTIEDLQPPAVCYLSEMTPPKRTGAHPITSNTRPGTQALPAGIPPGPADGFDVGEHEVIVQKGDTIHSLAQRVYGHISQWRRLAALNKLKYPYMIQPGQRLITSELPSKPNAAIIPATQPPQDTSPNKLPSEMPVVISAEGRA